ncbi:MAG: D-alanyl-D-alanine carboxypeptidase [Actinobacteria bacterium]|nr:MAG: D-alanyl-D-alanine carboxypeptidase [Actinomycetota bacterium]
MGATFGDVEEGRPRVPTGVLTPVVRRGRRRLGPAVALLVVAVAAGVVAVILVRRHERTRPAHAARKPLRPRLGARAAIVIDAGSGHVLWALHPHRRLAVASTTKIMTAYVALQQLPRDTIVTVSPAVTRVPLVKEGLRPHERVRAWKLFHGLLMFSGNDDALALAIASAGTRRAFVADMNDHARELGLRDTHFSSPSGVIDLGNYSSAWDLAALTRVALRNPRFRRVVRTRIAHIAWSAPTFEKVYVNKNPLLGTYPGANGVKTGWTTLAGHCLVASATRHGRTIVAVLLHDGNVAADARRLLDLGFATAP